MKCKKCGQELEIGVKFCPNCGEDCVSQDTGIPVKESVDKTKSAINDFGENMQKKEVEISGKKIQHARGTYVWVGYLGNNFMLFTICFSIDFWI